MSKSPKYKVTAKSITGLGRLAFKNGATVTASDLQHGVVDELVDAGHLTLISSKDEEIVSLPATEEKSPVKKNSSRRSK